MRDIIVVDVVVVVVIIIYLLESNTSHHILPTEYNMTHVSHLFNSGKQIRAFSWPTAAPPFFLSLQPLICYLFVIIILRNNNGKNIT